MEITVTSAGGALEHQPQRLHTYVKDGSLWEGMMPFWKSDNNQYITPDPLSNPINLRDFIRMSRMDHCGKE